MVEGYQRIHTFSNLWIEWIMCCAKDYSILSDFKVQWLYEMYKTSGGSKCNVISLSSCKNTAEFKAGYGWTVWLIGVVWDMTKHQTHLFRVRGHVGVMVQLGLIQLHMILQYCMIISKRPKEKQPSMILLLSNSNNHADGAQCMMSCLMFQLCIFQWVSNSMSFETCFDSQINAP